MTIAITLVYTVFWVTGIALQPHVPSMLLLARSHEALGQRAEARKWYARAAEKGNENARTALAALDAPPPPTSRSTRP